MSRPPTSRSASGRSSRPTRSTPRAPRGRSRTSALLLDGPYERLAVSATDGRGLETLRRTVFGLLRVVRVYSKIPGKKPEKDSPFTLRVGSTVMDMAKAVHKDFSEKLQYARVWNAAGLDGLRVNRDYVLADEDVVELHI